MSSVLENGTKKAKMWIKCVVFVGKNNPFVEKKFAFVDKLLKTISFWDSNFQNRTVQKGEVLGNRY